VNFYRTPFFLPWLYPSLVWRLPVAEKIIYLTFDDGPVPGATDFVLENLAKFDAKATFFCIGDNIRKHPDVFRKVISDGHKIGNHTFNHLKGWSTAVQKYIENTKLFDQHISEFHSTELSDVKLFRPPYGRIKRSQISALKAYKIIMWDVLSYDYRKTGSVERQLQRTIKATRPGSIVVFHDSFKAEPKMQYILPRYLEHFTDLGYRFEVIP
jgi:peptidoglycan/xylan/chitin deacetylase (PgdA/CDA1 family)